MFDRRYLVGHTHSFGWHSTVVLVLSIRILLDPAPSTEQVWSHVVFSIVIRLSRRIRLVAMLSLLAVFNDTGGCSRPFSDSSGTTEQNITIHCSFDSTCGFPVEGPGVVEVLSSLYLSSVPELSCMPSEISEYVDFHAGIEEEEEEEMILWALFACERQPASIRVLLVFHLL